MLSIQLLEWCLVKGITVRAKDIPGAENVRADRESRCRPDPSDRRMDSTGGDCSKWICLQ